MQKRYTIEHLGCANCAAKMEEKMNTLPGVAVSITFTTKTLSVEAEHPDVLLPKLQQIVSGIEPEAKIVPYARQRAKATHDHDHDHDCPDHVQEGWKPLVIGAVLLGFGALLDMANAAIFSFHVSFLAYLMAYLLLGSSVLINAYKKLIKGHVFDENFLMSIATIGAIIIGQFPEAIGVMLFYRVGEYFEERAVTRSRSQIMEAADMRPQTVILEDSTVIPAENAKPGDILLIRPGDRIGLDCTVVFGNSRIDTAPITGEPIPVYVRPGDALTSGCINVSGQLTARVEKPLSESMVTQILRAVESAAAGKPKIDRFISRFSRIYTPLVVIAAILIAVVPSLITGDWSKWVYTALSFLVISCPCALVLSVPLAFFSGIGAGSKKGILFKGGMSIEALAKVKIVALDKTGTLTKGEFAVQHGDMELLRICAACEQASSHPIGQSILAAAKAKAMILPTPESIEELPGHGILAKLEGNYVLCGNEALMNRYHVEIPAVTDAGAIVYVAIAGAYKGHLVVADAVKTGAARTVSLLKKMGLKTAILTGDNRHNARAAAAEAGIDAVYAQLLPEDKLNTLRNLRAEHGSILFVGDGINDSPVLAGADVGAAMGSGADAAIEAADVVYVTPSLNAIPTSVKIARQTCQIARQNVAFALAVKAAVMVLGLLGFASMWLAVLADSGTALLCILNSIRILYKK